MKRLVIFVLPACIPFSFVFFVHHYVFFTLLFDCDKFVSKVMYCNRYCWFFIIIVPFLKKVKISKMTKYRIDLKKKYIICCTYIIQSIIINQYLKNLFFLIPEWTINLYFTKTELYYLRGDNWKSWNE
jgi:hypothetical protein